MSTCQYELNCWPCYRRHDSLSRLVPWSMTANRINSLEIFILSRNSNVSFFPGNCFGCFLPRYHSDSRWWRHLLTLPLLQFGVEHGTSVTHLQRERDIEYQWKKQQLKNNRLSLASIHFLLFIGIFDFFFLLESWCVAIGPIGSRGAALCTRHPFEPDSPSSKAGQVINDVCSTFARVDDVPVKC